MMNMTEAPFNDTLSSTTPEPSFSFNSLSLTTQKLLAYVIIGILTLIGLGCWACFTNCGRSNPCKSNTNRGRASSETTRSAYHVTPSTGTSRDPSILTEFNRYSRNRNSGSSYSSGSGSYSKKRVKWQWFI